MVIVASNNINQDKILNSYKRIVGNCDIALNSKIDSTPIICSDEIKAPEIYDDGINLFNQAYTQGIGGHKGSVTYQGQVFDFIVLNIDACNKLNLSDAEFDGVFSHELGHIFNKYTSKNIPSVFDVMFNGATKLTSDEESKIRYENKLNTEVFADKFSLKVNTQNGLIGSMEKFIKANPKQNNQLFNDRLKILKKSNNGG